MDYKEFLLKEQEASLIEKEEMLSTLGDYYYAFEGFKAEYVEMTIAMIQSNSITE